jgi:hypothetical protein
MKKRTRRLLGGFAIAAGALGAAGAYVKRKKELGVKRKKTPDVWARPGMVVTFRAELMPGRDREDRTFRVEELLPSGRVSLQGFAGEHAEKEFDSIAPERPAV